MCASGMALLVQLLYVLSFCWLQDIAMMIPRGFFVPLVILLLMVQDAMGQSCAPGVFCCFTLRGMHMLCMLIEAAFSRVSHKLHAAAAVAA